jgi:hypothetical protein
MRDRLAPGQRRLGEQRRERVVELRGGRVAVLVRDRDQGDHLRDDHGVVGVPQVDLVAGERGRQ